MIGQRLARAVSKNVHMKKHRLRYSVRDMNLWQKGKRMTEPGFWKIATGFRASPKKIGRGRNGYK